MENNNVILVIYINVGNKDIPEIEAYIRRMKKEIELKTDKFTTFFVPVRKDDTRIECINPVLLDKKEYATKVEKILVEAEIRLNDFLEKPEPKKRMTKNDIINLLKNPPTEQNKTEIVEKQKISKKKTIKN